MIPNALQLPSPSSSFLSGPHFCRLGSDLLPLLNKPSELGQEFLLGHRALQMNLISIPEWLVIVFERSWHNWWCFPRLYASLTHAFALWCRQIVSHWSSMLWLNQEMWFTSTKAEQPGRQWAHIYEHTRLWGDQEPLCAWSLWTLGMISPPAMGRTGWSWTQLLRPAPHAGSCPTKECPVLHLLPMGAQTVPCQWVNTGRKVVQNALLIYIYICRYLV